MSPEDLTQELTREMEVLKAKIQTLTLAQRRIEREAQKLAAVISELSCQPQKPDKDVVWS
jgi:chaperonin cofactor prefoldin